RRHHRLHLRGRTPRASVGQGVRFVLARLRVAPRRERIALQHRGLLPQAGGPLLGQDHPVHGGGPDLRGGRDDPVGVHLPGDGRRRAQPHAVPLATTREAQISSWSEHTSSTSSWWEPEGPASWPPATPPRTPTSRSPSSRSCTRRGRTPAPRKAGWGRRSATSAKTIRSGTPSTPSRAATTWPTRT